MNRLWIPLSKYMIKNIIKFISTAKENSYHKLKTFLPFENKLNYAQFANYGNNKMRIMN